jgi:uncharacterized protein YcaQ
VKVTKEDARGFLLARQLLAPARSLEGGPDAVLAVFRRLGSLQLDPIAVAGLSHDLVVHARVADYQPASFSDRSRVAYLGDMLVNCWSTLPVTRGDLVLPQPCRIAGAEPPCDALIHSGSNVGAHRPYVPNPGYP